MAAEITIYVRALSNGEWFGGWAPVSARQEWLHPTGTLALFTLTDPNLTAEDEYEFFHPGTLLLARWKEDHWAAEVGVVE